VLGTVMQVRYIEKPTIALRGGEIGGKRCPAIGSGDFALRSLPGEPLRSVPRHERGRLRGILSDFRGVPRADTGVNDVGLMESPPNNRRSRGPAAIRRFTFLPTSISRSRATDHGRDA
jgi:hypothetical protein